MKWLNWAPLAIIWLPMIIILLTGCATTPDPEVRTVRVEVPIEVPCVDVKDVPERPAIDKITIDSKPGEKIAAVVIHRERLIAHAGELESLLVSCTE